MEIHPIITALMQSLSKEQKAQIWATENVWVNYYINTLNTEVAVTITCSSTFHNSGIAITADTSRKMLNDLHIEGLL